MATGNYVNLYVKKLCYLTPSVLFPTYMSTSKDSVANVNRQVHEHGLKYKLSFMMNHISISNVTGPPYNFSSEDSIVGIDQTVVSTYYMAQPSEVPRFKGDESPEEAEKWLETFVDSTGSFSDTGIFRLLGRRFATGSPARDWFNSLEGSAKASWEAFEQAFISRWIETAERIQKQRAWDAFADHPLSDEAIFGGKDFNYKDSCKILRQWAEEHTRLTQATGLEDEVLVETTKTLLPAFIQAYLHAYHDERHFKNVNDLCSEITSLPSQVILQERKRRQLAPTEKIVSMEKQIRKKWTKSWI
ncbi:hypothetical protein FRC02_004641 [Tulasnella sp. 418]|nr:hypothetical protein FRC02_004641 [Tulasnella sp. 418]